MEEWKIIEEFPDYAISNLGRVKSLPRKTRNGRTEFITKEKILVQHYRNERAYVNVYKNKQQHKIIVHQQVAKSFVYNPNPKEFNIVNHKNEDKYDNSAENLEWCNYSYNLNYGSRKNFQKRARGHYILYKNNKTGCELCCYSKSDFFKEVKMNNGGSMWNKLNKHIRNNEEDFFGYKVRKIEK